MPILARRASTGGAAPGGLGDHVPYPDSATALPPLLRANTSVEVDDREFGLRLGTI